ncbi:hypothetical protein ACV3RC_04380 [Clostridium perfringens]|uniref:hypothetical protein n=1 Tax=Clostridium perfringens TaxID=1502 RepID=UPI001C84B280|nr:hypothetical protein [Clostridium perfringens]EHK2305044.1 hypothetical protein [Clostridium perfringens]MDK0605650.1 hypothetical protein [Clostridium perfringens]MDK0764941.1 hypothetical protein [Clostridium perfringens]MDK0923869.1 hypothetical protein [Clostridium perfringens]MDM0896317.1 hypothetical protein [Clostridium perfringens]
MKKYTFNELVSEITGLKPDNYGWDNEYELLRRIKKTLDKLLAKPKITYENKDKYIILYKYLYNNEKLRLTFNKMSKRVEEIEFKEDIITIPYSKRELNAEESTIIREVLLEFLKDDSRGELLKKHTLTDDDKQKIREYNKELQLEEENYNNILNEFEVELEKVKLSAIPNKIKEEIFSELNEKLKQYRLEYDNGINIKFSIPK